MIFNYHRKLQASSRQLVSLSINFTEFINTYLTAQRGAQRHSTSRIQHTHNVLRDFVHDFNEVILAW